MEKKIAPIDTVKIIKHISYEIEHSTGKSHHPTIKCPHCNREMKHQGVECNSINHTVFLNYRADDSDDEDSGDEPNQCANDSDRDSSEKSQRTEDEEYTRLHKMHKERTSLDLTDQSLIFKEMTSKQYITCRKCKNLIDLSETYRSLAQEYNKLATYYEMVAAKIETRFDTM